MFRWIKTKLYFIVACYFLFFAGIQLKIWKPKIVVVTGSSGKTTLLHLIESALGSQAKYSHHANSTYGIAFDILGLKRQKLLLREWLFLFLAAPFKAFKKSFKERLYIVEADCDRPNEGRFMAKFLKPQITLWINSSGTHSMNFDKLVLDDKNIAEENISEKNIFPEKKFASVESAIAFEFGYFIEYTTSLSIVNADSKLIAAQLKRSKSETRLIKKEELLSYKLSKNRTEFQIGSENYSIPALLPEESFYSVAAALELLKFLGIAEKYPFLNFVLPPGRSSIFKGIKGITIIDSSYNATPDAVAAILRMFEAYPAQNKWLVLGDMLELGRKEQPEHEKLAELIAKIKSNPAANLEKIILMGLRISKYTYPKLKLLIARNSADNTNPVDINANGTIISFEMPKDALDYISAKISGKETILFKGARFLEGVIEHLLEDKNDISKLCRREQIWQIRRKRWGL